MAVVTRQRGDKNAEIVRRLRSSVRKSYRWGGRRTMLGKGVIGLRSSGRRGDGRDGSLQLSRLGQKKGRGRGGGGRRSLASRARVCWGCEWSRHGGRRAGSETRWRSGGGSERWRSCRYCTRGSQRLCGRSEEDYRSKRGRRGGGWREKQEASQALKTSRRRRSFSRHRTGLACPVLLERTHDRQATIRMEQAGRDADETARKGGRRISGTRSGRNLKQSHRGEGRIAASEEAAGKCGANAVGRAGDRSLLLHGGRAVNISGFEQQLPGTSTPPLSSSSSSFLLPQGGTL
eukprot:513350-Hanusia_phi.AAC.2